MLPIQGVYEVAIRVKNLPQVAVEGPMVHDWMPAKSAYFSDPDGHDLELCAPLINRLAPSR